MESVNLPDDLAALWYLVRRVAGLMDRKGEALFRDELGISLAQFLVLSVVDAYPGEINQQVVADRLGLSKGTVSRQLDRAVAAGLMTVQVAAHTRRENTIALTAEGSAMVRKGDAIFEQTREALQLADVDPKDMAGALRVLGGLLQTMEGEVRSAGR